MCAGCMTSAEFVLTSGALSVGALRLGLRSLLTGARRPLVSDEEAAAFVAGLRARPSSARPAEVVVLPLRARAIPLPGERLQRACA